VHDGGMRVSAGVFDTDGNFFPVFTEVATPPDGCLAVTEPIARQAADDWRATRRH
jgi:hypothetical protein